ncbi:MAG: NAD(P)-dependent oxidoreductase [Bdellovibrionales bacterium]|nr:NAD(P)-dependent oxidoreductase [Bdellovibrionales bacterium]
MLAFQTVWISTNMNHSKDNKKNEIILVTGGLGYLGSQLIRDIVAVNPEITVRVLDNFHSGSYRAIMDLPTIGHYEFIEGDILDPHATRRALEGVSTVIHLAAIVRTPMSFDRTTWVEQVNHWGTAHLLEACLNAKVQRFVFISTTAVYGPSKQSVNENEACLPQGIYAQSKRQAEIAINVAGKRGLQYTIFRLGVLYGLAPVTRFTSFANRFAYLAGIGRPLSIFGDGRQKRSLTHVRNASEAICLVLTHPNKISGKTFNLVDENISVIQVANIVQSISSHAVFHFTEQDIRTHLSFSADNGLLRATGWQPKISLQYGMSELLAQFQNVSTLPYPNKILDE